ncbi:MAG TPA: L,D-transpeptidase, partial [Dokdonella sp.]
WDEAASPEGPVSVLVSVPDRRVHVLRNGVRIGSAPLDVAAGFEFHGAVVFVMMQGTDDAASPLDPTQKRHRWATYPVRGDAAATLSMDDLAARLKVPDEFARHVYPILTPGASILVTDLPAVRTSAAAADAQPVLQSDAGARRE